MKDNGRIISIGLKLGILLALCSSSVLAQKTQPKDVGEVADANPAAWKEFSSAAGGFAVKFPGSPKESKEQSGEFLLNLIQLTSAFEYSVVYADYPDWANDSDPARAKEILDGGLEGAVAQVHSKLLEVKEVFIDKHPGRQYVEQMPNGTVLRGKTFLVGHRLYQIAITTPNEEGAVPEAVKFYQTAAARFLDSFRLLGP
jgi:hypothetical protein